MLRVIAFVLAAVSVWLEFTVAQLLTVFHGSTATVYFLTIGLYSFFLGVGAFYYYWSTLKEKNALRVFVVSEACLVASALLAPFIILLSGEISNHIIKLTVGFTPLAAIAFFSGIELPFLLSESSEKKEKDHIIFWDFFGMFVAGVLFAIYLLDFFSIFETLAIAVFITSFLMLYLIKRFKFSSLKSQLYFTFTTLISLIVIINDDFLIEIFRGFHGY